MTSLPKGRVQFKAPGLSIRRWITVLAAPVVLCLLMIAVSDGRALPEPAIALAQADRGGDTGGADAGAGDTGGGTADPDGGTADTGGGTADTGGASAGPAGTSADSDVSGQGRQEGINRNRRSGLSDAGTRSVTRLIAAVARDCEALPIDYRVDCLGQGLRWVAKQVPNHRAYRPVRSQLTRTGTKLQDLARTNQDTTRPKIGPKRRTSGQPVRTYRAVKRDRARFAVPEAKRVIDEAATSLLRSAENSKNRRVHYQRVARYLSSTKRILRS